MRKITGITLFSIAAWVMVAIALCFLAYAFGYLWGSKPVEPDMVYTGEQESELTSDFADIEISLFSFDPDATIAYDLIVSDKPHMQDTQINFGNFVRGYMNELSYQERT